MSGINEEFAELLLSMRKMPNMRRVHFLQRLLFEKMYDLKKLMRMPETQNVFTIDEEFVKEAVYHFNAQVSRGLLRLEFTLYAQEKRYTLHLTEAIWMQNVTERFYDVRRNHCFVDMDDLYVFVRDMFDDCRNTPSDRGVTSFMPYYIENYFGMTALREFEHVKPIEGI